MKKIKNIAIIAAAMVLVFALGVGSTLAYFVSVSAPVVNDFVPTKFGNPAVTETKRTYVAIPGVALPKDPKVSYTPTTDIEANQAEAYLYLTVSTTGGWTTSDNYAFTNQIGDVADDSLSFSLVKANWKYLGKTGSTRVYVYVVTSGTTATEQKLTAATTDIPVLTDNKVTVSSTITKDEMEVTDIDTKLGSVTFGAYAVQAKIDGVSNAKNAWNKVNTSIKIS